MKLGRYFIGLVSGLTFGMLFAPKKGSQLRNELVKGGGESGHEALMVLFNAFRDAGTDAVGEMKKLSESEQLRSALSMSKERMHEYLSHLEDSGYAVAGQAQEKIEEFADIASSLGTQFKSRALNKKKAVIKAVRTRVKSKKKVGRRVKKAVAKKVAGK